MGILLALALSACSYDVVIVKNVGQGCSSTAALEADTDIDASGTGTAAGGGADFMSRLARALATDDRCPSEDPAPDAPDG